MHILYNCRAINWDLDSVIFCYANAKTQITTTYIYIFMLQENQPL